MVSTASGHTDCRGISAQMAVAHFASTFWALRDGRRNWTLPPSLQLAEDVEVL
jgi:hypothetical protein